MAQKKTNTKLGARKSSTATKTEPKVKKPSIAEQFRELLLDNGFLSTKPSPIGDLKVAFYEKGSSTFFVCCHPGSKESLYNAGFLATITQAIYGDHAHFYPVHGDITLMTSDQAFTGKTRWEATEKMLRWRAEKLNKGVGSASTSGSSEPAPTQDVPAVEDSTAPGSTWRNSVSRVCKGC